MMRFVELSDTPSDLQLLDRIYEDIYAKEFPNPDERESLANMKDYLRRKAEGWYGRNNYHIVVAFEADRAVAIAIGDFLADGCAGVIEFLAVAPSSRGGHVGHKLLAHIETALAADAARDDGAALTCIVAEMNDPFAPGSLHDNLDPFLRAKIWSRWGYARLDLPYVQPSLSPRQKPVLSLLLMAKPLAAAGATSLPAPLIETILAGYMRWAMRIDEPHETPEFRAMAAYLRRRDVVALQGLDVYVGVEAANPLDVVEVGAGDEANLAAGLAVYRAAFPGGSTDIDPDEIRRLVAGHAGHVHFHYHFWAIRSLPAAPVEGMASFFTFDDAGFGGYVALTGSLKRKGRFKLLLARIEERMRRDSANARGLYIECRPGLQLLFSHFGFRTADLRYRQPPLSAQASYAVGEGPPLCLMYKELGRQYREPRIDQEDFRTDLRNIFRIVYGVETTGENPFFRDMIAQMERWPSGSVPFRTPIREAGENT